MLFATKSELREKVVAFWHETFIPWWELRTKEDVLGFAIGVCLILLLLWRKHVCSWQAHYEQMRERWRTDNHKLGDTVSELEDENYKLTERLKELVTRFFQGKPLNPECCDRAGDDASLSTVRATYERAIATLEGQLADTNKHHRAIINRLTKALKQNFAHLANRADSQQILAECRDILADIRVLLDEETEEEEEEDPAA